jgi:2-polyprenyl-3-methyl-5-hydroxy-6-metoxy-1,4-benzoquinol methylase
MTVNPILEDWLKLSHLGGDGKTALVIGCGLGDDAEALSSLGFAVTAFDISPTAIAWCQQRFPNSQVNYLVADLLNLQLPSKFDLVVESRTIQSLPLGMRKQVVKAIAQLVNREGKLLVITRYRDGKEPPYGPPWPLSESELSYFSRWGLTEINRSLFVELESITVKQFRLEYQRLNY